MLLFTPAALEDYLQNPAWPYVIIIGGPLLLVALIVMLRRVMRKRFRIAEEMLDQWAAAHELILLQRQFRWLARGIFWGNSNTEQSFWRITVRFPDGSVHQAWAWCGFWLLWMHFPKVDVRWDSVPAPVLPTRHSPYPPAGKSFGQYLLLYGLSAFFLLLGVTRFVVDRQDPDQTWSFWTFGTWEAVACVTFLIFAIKFHRGGSGDRDSNRH